MCVMVLSDEEKHPPHKTMPTINLLFTVADQLAAYHPA